MARALGMLGLRARSHSYKHSLVAGNIKKEQLQTGGVEITGLYVSCTIAGVGTIECFVELLRIVYMSRDYFRSCLRCCWACLAK